MLPPNCMNCSFSHFLALFIFISHSISCSLFLVLSLSISPSFCSIQTLIYTLRNVFHKMKFDLKGHMRLLLCRIFFLIFGSFDQITTLTYVLMDNFCPCFYIRLYSWIDRERQRERETKEKGVNIIFILCHILRFRI